MPHFNKQQLERISEGRCSPSPTPFLPRLCQEQKIYEDSSNILICSGDAGLAHRGHVRALSTCPHASRGRAVGTGRCQRTKVGVTLGGTVGAAGTGGRNPAATLRWTICGPAPATALVLNSSTKKTDVQCVGCVYVCICVCICEYRCIYVHICSSLVCASVYMFVHLCVHLCISVCVCVCTGTACAMLRFNHMANNSISCFCPLQQTIFQVIQYYFQKVFFN